jgi:hypothetical protein
MPLAHRAPNAWSRTGLIEDTFMRKKLSLPSIATVVLGAMVAGCASQSAQESGYNAFLSTIAAECKPLIIGSDNIGQAIMLNGLGAEPEHYTNFLGQTSALYNGGLAPEVYRNSMNSFLGGGSYNDRSFQCIIAHLPKK